MTKHYRMRKPVNVVKGAIGKIQHDHPILSGAATIAGGAAIVGGTIDQLVKGSPVGEPLARAGMRKIPGYQPLRELTKAIVGAMKR